MSQPMEQCENCLKMVPESKYATHFGYCRRNIKKCEKCGEMYDINSLEEHEEEFHRMGQCQYCKKQFPLGDVKGHESSCNQKPMFCQYCEQNVPVTEYPAHLRICESRTKVCDQCRKPITNKQYLVHLTNCPGYVEQKPAEVVPSYDKYIEQKRERFARDRPKVEEDIYQAKDSNPKGNFSRQPDVVQYGGYNKQAIKQPTNYARINHQYKKESSTEDYGYGGIKEKSKEYEAPKARIGTRDIASGNRVADKQPYSYGIHKPTNIGTGARSTNPTTTTNVRSSSRGGVNSNKNIPADNKRQEPKYGIGKPTAYKRQQPKSYGNEPTKDYYNKDAYRDHKHSQPTTYTGSRRDIGSTGNSGAYNGGVKHSSSSSSGNQARNQPQPKTQPQKPSQPSRSREPDYSTNFNPKDYDFDENGQIPNDFGGDADLNEQMMIWQSMQQQQKQTKPQLKPKKPASIPREFEGMDMNQSFFRDVDHEAQRAMYEDIKKKNRKY